MRFLTTFLSSKRRPKSARSAGKPRKDNRKPASRRLYLEPLEDRVVPSTILVTNTNDIGAGSLRQGILDANAAANVGGPDTIAFALPAADQRHLYYRNDGSFGQVNRAFVA